MVKRNKNDAAVITIGHVYPKQMNVYGDMGNITTLRYRLESRGYGVEYRGIESLADLETASVDILVGGGGQDSNQVKVQADMIGHATLLSQQIESGLVCLMICGMYQMLGKHFITTEGSTIKGAGILDLETRAGEGRLIGNVVAQGDTGKLVGFENHSGRTYLGNGVAPLATVISGAGNNGETGDEGAHYNNLFGTYLHGPLLAKNPEFADELIRLALKRRGIDAYLAPLDDEYEHAAAALAARRPR